MKIKSIEQAKNVSDKTVLVRVDFNVPMENGKIQDERKIHSHLSTLKYLLRHNCRIILITHLGRPKGKKVKKYSTRPLAKRLGELLEKDKKKNNTRHTEKFNRIRFLDTISHDKKLKEAAESLESRKILFLENLRFDPGEEEDNKKFARKLTEHADIYVNDAFSVCHRKHASVHAVKNYIPAYAGQLIKQEVENLEKIKDPEPPLVTIIGGAKIDTKINVIKKLSPRSDKILIGGGMANNFLAAHGLETGRSLVDDKNIKLAKKLNKEIKKNKLILPVDAVVSDKKNGKGKIRVKNVYNIKKTEIILDIGPKTQRIFSKNIKNARTLIWNGPLGMFEQEKFKHGTLGVARVMASRSKGEAYGVAGGGETVEALKISKMMGYVDWVSTGGGAMLSYLGGAKMPGLKKLIK